MGYFHMKAMMFRNGFEFSSDLEVNFNRVVEVIGKLCKPVDCKYEERV